MERAPFLRPFEQERRDRVVEQLVRRRHRPDDVVVDLPVLDRLEDRLARLAKAPFAPADQQGALRVRMQLAHLAEKLAARGAVERLSCEHERDRLVRGVEIRDTASRLQSRGDALDTVVPRVPVEQLALDGRQVGRVAVDGEDDRCAHRPYPTIAYDSATSAVR